MPEVSLSRLTAPARCAYCHGDLDTRSLECPGCRTALHEDCGALGCPTMGCAVRPAPRALPRPAWDVFLFAACAPFYWFFMLEFALGIVPIVPAMTRGPAPFYLLGAFLKITWSFCRVVSWLRSLWKVRASRRRLTRRSHPKESSP